MTPNDVVFFLFKVFGVTLIILFWTIEAKNHQEPPVPARLLQIAGQIRKGNPPRRYWDTLRAMPMFDEHYRRMPHRMTCSVLSHKVNGESIWQLRVGFRTTPNEDPVKFISIPVYKNGHIYDV